MLLRQRIQQVGPVVFRQVWNATVQRANQVPDSLSRSLVALRGDPLQVLAEREADDLCPFTLHLLGSLVESPAQVVGQADVQRVGHSASSWRNDTTRTLGTQRINTQAESLSPGRWTEISESTRPQQGRCLPQQGRPRPLQGRRPPNEGRPSPQEGRPSPNEGRRSPKQGRPFPQLGDLPPKRAVSPPRGTAFAQRGAAFPPTGAAFALFGTASDAILSTVGRTQREAPPLPPKAGKERGGRGLRFRPTPSSGRGSFPRSASRRGRWRPPARGRTANRDRSSRTARAGRRCRSGRG